MSEDTRGPDNYVCCKSYIRLGVWHHSREILFPWFPMWLCKFLCPFLIPPLLPLISSAWSSCSSCFSFILAHVASDSHTVTVVSFLFSCFLCSSSHFLLSSKPCIRRCPPARPPLISAATRSPVLRLQVRFCMQYTTQYDTHTHKTQRLTDNQTDVLTISRTLQTHLHWRGTHLLELPALRLTGNQTDILTHYPTCTTNTPAHAASAVFKDENWTSFSKNCLLQQSK